MEPGNGSSTIFFTLRLPGNITKRRWIGSAGTPIHTTLLPRPHLIGYTSRPAYRPSCLPSNQTSLRRNGSWIQFLELILLQIACTFCVHISLTSSMSNDHI